MTLWVRYDRLTVSAAILSFNAPLRSVFLQIAARYTIPAIYEQRQLVADGGLVSYRKLQATAIAFVIIGTGTEPCLSCSLHGGQSRSPPLLRGNRGDQPRGRRRRQLPRP